MASCSRLARSGWRLTTHLHPTGVAASAESRLAAHARPGAQVRRASASIANGLLLCCFRPAFPPVATVPRHKVSTVQVCCLRPVFPSVTHRVGFGPRTVSRHEVSTVQVCCLRPVFPPVTHRVGFGPPSVTARGVDCAGVLPPARLPFRHSLGRIRAAHSVTARGVDCAGVLPPARLPSCHSLGRIRAAHSVTARVSTVQPGAPLQDLGGLWPLTLRHPTYAYSTLRCLEWLACTGWPRPSQSGRRPVASRRAGPACGRGT